MKWEHFSNYGLWIRDIDATHNWWPWEGETDQILMNKLEMSEGNRAEGMRDENKREQDVQAGGGPEWESN